MRSVASNARAGTNSELLSFTTGWTPGAAPKTCWRSCSISILTQNYTRSWIFSTKRIEPGSGGQKIRTSFIQRLPFARRHFRKYLPLMPRAVERFDLSGYDLIISSSHAAAKGAMTGPNQFHICLCYSPARYAWEHRAAVPR